MKDHGGFRPFVQFQRIRLHSRAFNLLRHQRGERICQELHNFLTAVKFEYPYGVRQSTLLEAIQSTKRMKFRNVNFFVLKFYFTLSELSKLPGTSTEYETGGMWVDGDIHPYEEKKYKGLERLQEWEKDQWMVPRLKDCQTEDRLKQHMKEIFRKKYVRRTRLVLQSKLHGRNKIKAINTWAISLMRYGAGIINWRKNDLKDIDRRTRKLMTMNKALNSNSDVARLCVKRKQGERGLISVESCIYC